MPDPRDFKVDGTRVWCHDLNDSSTCHINGTQWPPENDINFYFILYKVIIPIVFGLVSVCGLIGNSLVIFVILTESKMRTTVNLLLLNLALSDIIFSGVCVPFVTYHFSAENWLIGDVACKLFNFFIYVCVYVTVYTLVGISVVRYMAVVFQHGSSRIRTKRNICVAVGVLWAVMLVINCPIILLYRVKQFEFRNIPPYLYCGMKDKDTGQKLFFSFFFLTYIIPLTLICTFYILLLRYLRLQRKGSSINHNHRSSRKAHTKTAHASKILFVVVAVFGICWLPLHLYLLISYFGVQPQGRLYEILRPLCLWIAYANSMMNPLIYNYVSKDFRQSFKHFYRRYICCHGGEPEVSASDEQPEDARLKASNYSAM